MHRGGLNKIRGRITTRPLTPLPTTHDHTLAKSLRYLTAPTERVILFLNTQLTERFSPMTRKMYNNRYRNIHLVCHTLHSLFDEATATDLSRVLPLSRQAINSILKDSALLGYTEFREHQHRPNVLSRHYSITRLWTGNARIYTRIAKTAAKQKALL